MRILIVEDEFSLADVIRDRLVKEKYIVDISYNGADGLYNALMGIYDLIILDVMLPKVNGFDILKKVRDQKIESKVIMLTARGELDDKLTGLKNGADDYLTKPFHMEELVARVNVQLKKDYEQIKSNTLEAFDLRLDTKSSKLFCTLTNNSIDMICKEFLLLEYLMHNQNQIVSKEQINDKIWGIDNESESNNIEAYISFIRKKLRAIGSKTNIKAIRGLGYRLEVLDEEVKN